MPVTKIMVDLIKSIAGNKDVIILLGAGDSVTGVLKEVTTEHIKLESQDDLIYLTVDSIKALRIRK